MNDEDIDKLLNKMQDKIRSEEYHYYGLPIHGPTSLRKALREIVREWLHEHSGNRL